MISKKSRKFLLLAVFLMQWGKSNPVALFALPVLTYTATIYGSLPQLLHKMTSHCSFKACPAVTPFPRTSVSISTPQSPLHLPRAAHSRSASLSPLQWPQQWLVTPTHCAGQRGDNLLHLGYSNLPHCPPLLPPLTRAYKPPPSITIQLASSFVPSL